MNHPNAIVPPEIVPVSREQYSSPSLPKTEKAEFITTQQLYDAVFENAFHPMYIGNGGKVIRFNDKFARLFGFSPDEIQKMKPVDFFETNDHSFINFLNQRKEKGIAKAEVTAIKKSGERFPCRISSVIYESDKGEKRTMNTLVNISQNIAARWNIAG
jgi:PAS domain S-box-containing protein